MPHGTPAPHPAVLPARPGPWKAEMSQTRPLRGPFQVWPHSGQLWRKLRIREGTGSCGLWGHLEAQTRGPTPLCGLEPVSEAPSAPMERWRPLMATELFTSPSSREFCAQQHRQPAAASDSLEICRPEFWAFRLTSVYHLFNRLHHCFSSSLFVKPPSARPYLLYLIESSPHPVKKPGSEQGRQCNATPLVGWNPPQDSVGPNRAPRLMIMALSRTAQEMRKMGVPREIHSYP